MNLQEYLVVINVEMRKKQLFIRGDLNALCDSHIPLRNPVWISILKNEYGPKLDGQNIWLYEKVVRDGKQDLIIFPGIVKNNSGISNEYLIQINEEAFEYLSESTEFGEHSIEEIVGLSWDNEVNEKFPEYKV